MIRIQNKYLLKNNFLRIRVSYIPNYKTAISDKITCWEVEQFPLKKTLSRLLAIQPCHTQNTRNTLRTVFLYASFVFCLIVRLVFVEIDSHMYIIPQ